MLAEEHLLQHVFCCVFTCGNLCEKNRSIELNTKHSDISTKVGPEENQWGYNGCIQSWPFNVPVMFTCQSNDPSEFIQIYQLILIKFVTCIYRISKRISFKPFFPTCFRYQIHSGIEHGHDLGTTCTTKNRWITNQKILGLSIVIYLFLNIGLMVGLKAKARASAYLTKLGWRCGCIFVGGVCVRGWVYMFIWLSVLEGWECIGKEGEEKPHHYIIFVTLSSLVHEKIYPINLIKMTKIENKNCKCSK